MTRRIKVVPYDSNWPRWFEEEAVKIKQALGENCVAVHHVGSTSVPGLTAKPQIDIIAVVKDYLATSSPLVQAGYIEKGEFNIPFHIVFGEGDGNTRANIHVFEEGNPEIELNLLFRDYLRAHQDARDAYGSLKNSLVAQDVSHERVSVGLSKYTLGKDEFIKEILIQTGFNGLCMRLCTHHEEWDIVRSFRQKYFFDKVPVADPYTWTFDHKDHVHFVLYLGTQIIGYTHLQLWPDDRAALRIIVIDEPFRNEGLGAHFLRLCERWLKQKGYSVLQTQSSPDAFAFYSKHGYTEMPFNDPDGYESDPRDIELGKVLRDDFVSCFTKGLI